jgi:hypothetical protein
VISIGEATFHVEVAHIGDAALEEYARALFSGFDESTAALPLEDFALYLDIEEGSIKGRGKILAAAAVLYVAIGEFGDFAQGVREIASVSRRVMSTFASDAPNMLGRPNTLVSKRTNAATLGKLEGLFAAVRSGALRPDEATRRAVELLGEDKELPETLQAEIEASVHRIVKNPQQIDWVVPDADVELQQGVDTTRQPGERVRSRIRKAVAPARKLRIEIRKSSRRAKPRLTIMES